MNNSDNIIRILKSLNPIKKSFSRTNKDLNLAFKYSSFDNLLKVLDKKQTYKGEFFLPKDKTPHKNDYNVNFKNSIDYINELSNINNLPLVAKNKNYILNGHFNQDFENENLKREKSIKFLLNQKALRKKEKIKRSKDILTKYRNSETNLTLGKYNPNYDSIKPRIPYAFIRNPNVHIKDSWLSNNPFRNTFEVFKLKQKEENKNIIKDNKLNTRISKIKINENISSYNNSQISQKTDNSVNINNIIYINNNNEKIKIRKIKRLNNIYPAIKNVKGLVLFDKMKKRKSLFKKCESNIDYFPDYKFIFPHTPSYIFKYVKDKEKFKRYMNGKIIRGYNYNSDDYYVMQLRNKSIQI